MATAVTTLSLFRYSGLRNKLWAFGMMQFAHQHLQDVPGQEFYRLMGSGTQLGRPWPDWSVYALLQCWRDESDADRHFRDSALQARYGRKTTECSRIYLKTLKAQGQWGAEQPFKAEGEAGNSTGRLAVITRAVIRSAELRAFWSQAAKAQVPVTQAPGLLYTKGIGEVPFKNMATFSIWESEQHMKDYAYGSVAHRESIRMTREREWYSEELFARFRVLRQEGNWRGENFSV